MRHRITERDLDRRLTRIITRKHANRLAQESGIRGFAGIDDPEQLAGLFSKIGKALKKAVQAPLNIAKKVVDSQKKVVGQVTHAIVKANPFLSSSMKQRVESAIMKPVNIAAAINTVMTTGSTAGLRAIIKHDTEEAKKVLKVVLPVVAVIAQFFPGIGTVIGIAAGLASAAMKASEARTMAKRLQTEAANTEAQDKALADEANAQADLLLQQAAVYDQAVADVRAALAAGYIYDGMTGQQIQDGVAKWKLAQQGVNITSQEAKVLLTDTIKQATSQASQQAAQVQAIAAQPASAPVQQIVTPPPAATDPLQQQMLYSPSMQSGGGGYQQQYSGSSSSSQEDSQSTTPAVTTAGVSGVSPVVLGALGVGALLFAMAKPSKSKH
jgi:hypothetical protein